MAEDNTICHFVPVEEFWEEAQEFFEKEKNNITNILEGTPVTFEHFGGSSVPGSLTKRDIDIQIRVNKENFKNVVNYMKRYADIKREDLWTENIALFKNEKKFPLDYLVTVNGSEAEQHYFGARDLLLKDSILLNEYNDLKKSFEGNIYKNYRAAKKVFWQRVLKDRLGLKHVS